MEITQLLSQYNIELTRFEWTDTLTLVRSKVDLLQELVRTR